MRANGTRIVWLHSIHGSFRFPLRRFKDEFGELTDFIALTGPIDNGISHRLAEEVCYLANRLSFAELEHCVTRRRGIDLSVMTLHRIVQRAAQDVEDIGKQAIADTIHRSLPPLVPTEESDLYDPGVEEVIVMEDGILAKAQKAQRKPGCKRKTRFIATDFATLQRPDGRYSRVSESLVRGESESFGVSDSLRAAFIRHWSGQPGPLRVVALTDGARCIRQHLTEVFGVFVFIVLDWYHLTKKLQVLLSQVCFGNAHRKSVQRQMQGHLWRGDVKRALAVLDALKARKPEKSAELRKYLVKHASEIIDYGRRQEAGKVVGSGRMEKTVDQTVALRQKRKGMSWTEQGSRALSALRIVELNGMWDEFWEAKAAA